jgi:hypothetical protein
MPSRRDFIKGLGAGTGSILLFGAATSSKADASSFTLTQSKGKAMLYDALKCVGCRACQNACKEWNNLPAESTGYGDIYDNPGSLSANTWTIIKAREYTLRGNLSCYVVTSACTVPKPAANPCVLPELYPTRERL